MKDKKPVLIFCKNCGISFIRRDPAQKYCIDCATSIKYRKCNAMKNESRKKPRGETHIRPETPPELEGWSTKGKSLALVDAEAKEFGMSYGKYMAAIQGGNIERILMARGMTPEEWKAKLRAAKRKVRK